MSSSIVARYSTVGEAESARTALEAAGIEVHVLDESMVSLDWTWSVALGGVKLLVRDEDREQSELVLASVSREATVDEVPETVVKLPDPHAPPPNPSDTIEDHCPRCGSADVYDINYRKLKAASMLITWLIFLLLPLWPFLPKRRCEQCKRLSWW